jgi:hypothetical protein
MKFGIFGIFGAFMLLVIGCSDENASTQRTEQHPKQHSGLADRKVPPNWLDATSDVEPAGWLIERETASGRAFNSEDADKLRQSLATASKLFKEDPRMIANRAVQLEEMLDPTDGRESAVWLLNQLTYIVPEPGRIEGFGALGQQYVNMRKAGFGERDALQDLSRRYGSRG